MYIHVLLAAEGGVDRTSRTPPSLRACSILFKFLNHFSSHSASKIETQDSMGGRTGKQYLHIAYGEGIKRRIVWNYSRRAPGHVIRGRWAWVMYGTSLTWRTHARWSDPTWWTWQHHVTLSALCSPATLCIYPTYYDDDRCINQFLQLI